MLDNLDRVAPDLRCRITRRQLDEGVARPGGIPPPRLLEAVHERVALVHFRRALEKVRRAVCHELLDKKWRVPAIWIVKSARDIPAPAGS